MLDNNRKRCHEAANRKRRQQRQRFRPLVESLERRDLLTAISWISPVDGFWDEPTNWLPPQVPGSGDDVTIDLLAVNPTIELRDSRTVNTLLSREAIRVTGGTFQVNAASQIDASTMTLANGSLTAFGSLTNNQES